MTVIWIPGHYFGITRVDQRAWIIATDPTGDKYQ